VVVLAEAIMVQVVLVALVVEDLEVTLMLPEHLRLLLPAVVVVAEELITFLVVTVVPES
jgi:hypothetical protein